MQHGGKDNVGQEAGESMDQGRCGIRLRAAGTCSKTGLLWVTEDFGVETYSMEPVCVMCHYLDTQPKI
jgi:hypothetical protein